MNSQTFNDPYTEKAVMVATFMYSIIREQISVISSQTDMADKSCCYMPIYTVLTATVLVIRDVQLVHPYI